MYRLAEKVRMISDLDVSSDSNVAYHQLGIPQLEKLALEAIQNSLTPPVILRESLTKFTSRFAPTSVLICVYFSHRFLQV